ncbi:hypothetical protein F383_04239 [Gossypium arboreum]|uniref:Uncharacterized protein n=1 Tax=Gossypium arboreum TaxID=29729 RepID=A0A0B0PBQ6_GOSAR|nr:hypothetical protein F383_04239 [Gossypium arboreum]
MYANFYMHNIRGKMQGTRRSKASEIRCVRLLPSSQEVMYLKQENAIYIIELFGISFPLSCKTSAMIFKPRLMCVEQLQI